MDFLDPKKRKARSRRLVAGYILMAIALALGSMVVLFRTYGYDLDRKTGKVIQNGLVYLSAKPQSARVFVNDQERGNTDTRLTIPAGLYKVELKRDGYRTWGKTFSLDGGSIEQLVYPRLFPKKIKPKDLQLYSHLPTFASQSLDKRWLIINQPGSNTKFDLFDLNNPDQNPEELSLASNLLSSNSGRLSAVEWASDNRHLLVKHSLKNGSEFILIDRQSPTSSTNLSQILNVGSAKISLHDKKYDSYFIFNSKTLRTATLENRNPKHFLSNVVAYKAFGNNTVLYATSSSTETNKVSIQVKDSSNTYIIRTLPAGTSYLLDLAKFKGQWLIMAGARSENRAYIYKDPFPFLRQKEAGLLTPAVTLRLNSPKFSSLSQNSRFMALQNGRSFAVYDAENDRRYYFDLASKLSQGQQAEWMDGHRLQAVYKHKVIVFEFDGLNGQTLTAASSPQTVFFDQGYEALYAVSPSVEVKGRSALTSGALKVP